MPASSRSAVTTTPDEDTWWLPTLAGGPGGALWAGSLGLLGVAVCVMLAWATDSRSGSAASDALRTAGQVWLLAHGTTLETSGGPVGVAPLGLTVVLALLLVRAGRVLAEQCTITRWSRHAVVTLCLAVPYGGLTAAVAGLSATPAVRPSPWQAFAGGLVLGVLAGGVGVARGAPWVDRRTVPVWVRVQGRAVVGALAVLVGAGGLLLAVALGTRVATATTLWSSVGPGVVGAPLLLLLCLALLPNLVLWCVGFAAGPGFAVGAGTSVSPFAVHVASLPAFPLLAGVPASGTPPVWAGAVLLVPVVAGVVAGLLAERAAPSPDRRAALLRSLAVAGWTGLVVAGLSVLAGGSLGGVDLAELGVEPLAGGLHVAVEVAVGACAGALWRVRRFAWR